MKLFELKQTFKDFPAVDAYQACRESLAHSGLLEPVQRGQRVCLGLPSRGISCLADLTRACVEALQARGAQVCIVPAMGSHGGGSAEGQARVLASAGIDEEHLGAPVCSCMQAVSLGFADMPGGQQVEVFWDPYAASADHVLVINRIKEHTAFSGPQESGLMKIISVGLGKAQGAREIHARGLAEAMPAAARFVLTHKPVLGGVAVVENALHQPALVEAIPADGLPERETELLTLARQMLPKIPFHSLDVLVVCQMGKDISGTGMDTNVIGKYRRNWGVPEPAYGRIVVLDLTENSHGNATGVGFADVITRRLYERIDYEATVLNCLTAENFNGAKIPIIWENDREAIQCGLGGQDEASVRLAIIHSTLNLETMWVSEAILDGIPDSAVIKTTGNSCEFFECFDRQGILNLSWS